MDIRVGTLIAIAALAVSANANLISNGSFETLPAGGFNEGDWGLWSTIPGWYSSSFTMDRTTYNNPIEVGLGTVYGVTGYDGNNVCELDSTGDSQINQDLTLDRFHLYKLSFSYARRDGTTDETNKFSVLWDGFDIANITPTSTAMKTVSFFVLSDGLRTGANVLSFRATGTSDSYGGVIDNVSLNSPAPVPEPASLGALAMGAFGIWRRRKQS